MTDEVQIPSRANTRARAAGIGSQVIRKLAETGDVMEFRRLQRALLKPEEHPAYDFMAQHLRRHNALPSVTTLHENQVTVALMAPDSIGYYFERLSERHRYDVMVENVITRMVPLIQSRDTAGAEAIMRDTITALTEIDPQNDLSTLAQNAPQMIDAYFAAQRNVGNNFVTLGYDRLDNLAGGGARPGDVIVIAGRPNVGKSYILLWMIVQAWRQGKSVMVSSMEMRRERIEERLVAIDTGFNPDAIRRGRLDRWAQDDFLATLRNLDDRPPVYSLAGKYRKSVSDFRRGIERCRPAAAYIDAAYLASPDYAPGSRNDGKRHDRIADVIEQIKDMAEDCGIPVFVTVQFNREVKKGKPKPMDLASIGGSDAIPQIASIVIGAQYGFAPHETTRRHCEMGKNREGPTCEFDINFLFRPRMDLSMVPFTEGAAATPANPDDAPMANPDNPIDAPIVSDETGHGLSRDEI